MENEVVELYLDDIIPNRFQPREVFDDQALKELAISIREHGVIQPILVRKFGEKYEIIAGERRYKASTMAGLTKIPAIVKNLDDKESSKVALIENLQRRDLTPIEEARTYQKILDLDEMTQEQLAKTMGKSQSAVSNKLRLLSLPDEIQEALLKEEISERHARSLLNVDDKNTQINLLKEIIANKMTVRELDSKIKNLNSDSENNSNNGGVTNDIFKSEVKEEINNISQPVTSNSVDLFSGDTISTNNTNTETLFNKDSDNFSVSSVKPFSNNSLEEPKFTEILENNKIGTDNMNNNNLFENDNVSKENSEIFNDNKSDNVASNNSLFDDPTTVDINKIREQSTDINFNTNNNNNNINNTNINDLLGKKEDDSNRFIPNFYESNAEKNEDGNEVIGKGLLAGMPVINPIEKDLNTEISENNSINKENNNSIFNSVSSNEVNSSNNLNSLFSQPSVDSINNVQDTSSSNLFQQNNNQNEINNDSLISTNNIQVAVSGVRDVVKSYQDKGYIVSIEELDLDREIQLIIKFNKN